MLSRLFPSSVLLLAVVAVAPAEEPAKLNVPPEGFTALFNGKDLTGWVTQRSFWDTTVLKEHCWKVIDGILTLDPKRGKRGSFRTEKEFSDFILYVDWRFSEEGGDSGVEIPGTQIQIGSSDSHRRLGATGGMYSDYRYPKYRMLPVIADRPEGEWNTFVIKKVGRRVTVHLNGMLVVDNLPIWPDLLQKERRPIGLQQHDGPLWFRNIFIKELPATEETRQGPANQ